MHVTIARSTIYQLVSKIVTSGTGFFLTLVIASIYGATFYGDFTKVTSLIALFYLFVDFGFNAVFLQLSDHETKLATLLWGRIIIAGLLILIVNIGLHFLPYNNLTQQGISPQLYSSLFIFSLTILSQAIIFSCLALFQKEQQYQKLVWLTIAGSLLTFVLCIIFSFSHLPLTFILGGYTLGSFLSAGLALVFVNKKITVGNLDTLFLTRLAKQSWPIGLMLIFNLIYFRIDIILLSFFRSASEVGIYGYSYKFFDFLLTIPLFLSNAFYPLLLEHQKASTLQSKKNQYIFIYFIISLILTTVAWFLAPFIASLRVEFLPSVFVLRLLLISLPLFFLTSILQWIHIAQGRQKALLWIYGLGAVFNIVVNYIFIPVYGMYASALITVISEGLILLLLFYMPLGKNN